MKEAILFLFNLSWKSGTLPDAWKSASIKFIRKHGKTDFYSPSSYRPISLTSTLCKIMERVVLTRLEAHIEGNHLLDVEQEGFRRFHSTTYAVLNLVQAIKEGFENGDATVECFIDLEKAYDSVWREGLMVKMSEAMVNGRMWSWIHSFLGDRKGRCKIDDLEGPEFTSRTGLSQGSVLSPLLINIFIKDMFSQIKGRHTKFADDGTLWHTGDVIEQLAGSVCEDVSTIQDWCRKWRMKLSLGKTEVSCFQLRETHFEKSTFCKVGNNFLKYNKTPKILGITLDEKLKRLFMYSGR